MNDAVFRVYVYLFACAGVCFKWSNMATFYATILQLTCIQTVLHQGILAECFIYQMFLFSRVAECFIYQMFLFSRVAEYLFSHFSSIFLAKKYI